MNLTTEQLNKHLDTGSLSAVYIISGDEPLLIQESSVAIRKQAKLNGYDERKVFHVESAIGFTTAWQLKSMETSKSPFLRSVA